MQHFTRIVAAREGRGRLSAGSGHPAAELVRRRPGVSLEGAREVTLIGEAGLEGDVAERHAVMGPKDPGQMNGMHADLACDVRRPQAVEKAGMQHVRGPQEPGRRPAFRRPEVIQAGGEGEHLQGRPLDRERRDRVRGCQLARQPPGETGDAPVPEVRDPVQYGGEGTGKVLPAGSVTTVQGVQACVTRVNRSSNDPSSITAKQVRS